MLLDLLLEILTAIALGGARKLSQVLSHSEMDPINTALKNISINSTENQVLGRPGFHYFKQRCSGLYLRICRKKKEKRWEGKLSIINDNCTRLQKAS